jgi:hypothetical protein
MKTIFDKMTKVELIGRINMITYKSIIFLVILFLFSCRASNKQVISKWDNGKPKLERIYSGEPGYFTEKEYYDNGQLASETKFIDSVRNSESVGYYKDGKISGKCIYRNGKINGEVTE